MRLFQGPHHLPLTYVVSTFFSRQNETENKSLLQPSPSTKYRYIFHSQVLIPKDQNLPEAPGCSLSPTVCRSFGLRFIEAWFS